MQFPSSAMQITGIWLPGSREFCAFWCVEFDKRKSLLGPCLCFHHERLTSAEGFARIEPDS